MAYGVLVWLTLLIKHAFSLSLSLSLFLSFSLSLSLSLSHSLSILETLNQFKFSYIFLG
jgi:hypothetical protein